MLRTKIRLLRLLLKNKDIMSSPLASIDLPAMDLSSSIFDFDFGAGFDDFGVEVFDDFGADFERDSDYDFLGTAFDAGFDSTVEDSVTAEFDDVSVGDWSGGSGRPRQRRRVRRSNRVYRIESVTESAWFRYFTRPGMTRELTHELSASDRFGHFRHYFRMPLWKVEELCDLLIVRGYIPLPRTRCRQEEFRERTELLVMSSLYLLGTGASFRACQPLCYISTSEVRKFFLLFLNAIVDMRDDQIYMPRNQSELTKVEECYNAVGLPGCCGSVDVVHVKWSHCPAGDFNRAKGKETFPSLGFQCITDFNRRILSVYGPHFGSRNDMDIVKTDVHVHAVAKNPLHREARWWYYGHDGHVRTNRGSYLICDNGYLRWPTTICPFTRVGSGSAEGYFSSNLEGVRKDVECTFGILKKRWRILNNGFFHRRIDVCSNIFITCCWINNFLLDDVMERSNVRVGRGAPIDEDGIWLSGLTAEEREHEEMEEDGEQQSDDDCELSQHFLQRRQLLVKHLHLFRQKGPIRNQSGI